MVSIISSIITGFLALVGVIFSNVQSNKKVEHQLEVNQAVTTTKLDDLTREVREHSENTRKIPVLEEKVNQIDRRVEMLERR
jgi:hypothetical protein